MRGRCPATDWYVPNSNHDPYRSNPKGKALRDSRPADALRNTGAPTPTPTRVPLLRLRVVGNQIQNENGDEVILRGLAPVDPLQQAYPDRFGMIDRMWEEDTYQVMSEWGANVVRLPIHPHAWRSLARADALRVLDQAVAWAGKYGMHVMIEFHGGDWPPEEQYTEDTLTSTAEIRQFWDVISSRYADNTVVAFYELYGEPSAGGIWEKTEAERLADWLVWKEYVEELIGVVRANDADKIVIVPGLSYAQDLAFVVEAPIEQENVVYSCHPYPAVYDSVEDWDTHMGEVKSHFPVMVTEFGFNNDSPNWELREDGWEGEGRYGEAIINYLETHGIGWVAWCFSHNWGPLMLKNPDYEPTEAGEFFRAQLQTLNR